MEGYFIAPARTAGYQERVPDKAKTEVAELIRSYQ